MKTVIKVFLIALLGTGLMSNAFLKSPVMTIRSNSANQAAQDTLKKDPDTGMVVDSNLYMVKAQCTSCHSSKLIIQNRFTRDGWKQKIRWMQAKHNLWDLGETEKQVLDYLEKNYSPSVGIARRAPLKNVKWYKLDQK